jgi:branched-chain amino acid aminotransferase
MIYLNGKLVERDKALISVLDYGFLYGFGLFETMRAYEGKVFRIEQHLKRLQNSARMLCFTVDMNKIRSAITETIKVNKLENARVRVTLTVGSGKINASFNTYNDITILVVAERYIPYKERVYRNGFKAITSSLRSNSQSMLSGLKSTSYLMYVLAKKEATAAGADEAICLNEKGLLSEASMSNVFLIQDTMLNTPAIESGILPGITRQTVIELALTMDIPCKEGDITLDDLYGSQEAFLTNSLLEIMPLTSVDCKTIGSGRSGDMTKNILMEYRKLVSRELNK